MNTEIFLERRKRLLALKAISGEHRRQHLLCLGKAEERYLLVFDPPEDTPFNVKDDLFALFVCSNSHISSIFIPGTSQDRSG